MLRLAATIIFVLVIGVLARHAPAADNEILIPVTQTRFQGLVDEFARRGRDAPNDLARANLRVERSVAFRERRLSGPEDWIGIIVTVRAAESGAAVVLVQLFGSEIFFSTRPHDSPSADDFSLIRPGTALFSTAAALRPGQMVRFSGQTICWRDLNNPRHPRTSCPMEMTGDPRRALAEPIFLTRFTKIEPVD